MSLFLIIWYWRELLPTLILLVKRHLMWQQKPRRSLPHKSLSTELQRVYSRTLKKVALARREQTQRAFPHSNWQNREKGLQQRLTESLSQIHAILWWCYSVLILFFVMYVRFQPTVDHPGWWSSRQKHDCTQFLSQWILFAQCNHHFHFSHNCFAPISTLLNIKVLKRFFKRCHKITIFGSTKNHSVKGYLKNHLFLLFIIWRTFIHRKQPFVKQKGSSDVKGSSWNHLDKKVLLSMAS